MSATPRTQSIFNDLVKQNYGHASIEVAIKEVEQLETELADARAEIERLGHHRRAGWTEIERKNRLIAQMRGALEIAAPCVKAIFGYYSKDYAEVKAALTAAAKGEI